MSSPPDGPLWLIGLPGAGKSAAGRRVARRLARPFLDLDRTIELAAGMPVAQIFADEGEQGFRQRELRAITAVLVQPPPPPVVACGGGVISRQRARQRLLRSGLVIWLDLPWAEALERCRRQGPGRPLLTDEAAFRRRLPRRLQHYQQLGVRVDASAPLDDVVERLLALLAR